MGSLSRRRFLRSTALAGAGLGSFALGRHAAGFETKRLDAKTQAEYANGCGSPEQLAYHQQLLTEAKAKLGSGMTEEQIANAIAQLTCPVCGCHLSG